MRPEDIRKLYQAEDAADAAEARATQQEARTNPDTARALLLTLYSLAGEDRDFDRLLQLVLKVGTMQLLVQEAEQSDRFALQLAEVILDGMETMKPGSRVTRGRQNAKKASSA
jgi:hypothetical protein